MQTVFTIASVLPLESLLSVAARRLHTNVALRYHTVVFIGQSKSLCKRQFLREPSSAPHTLPPDVGDSDRPGTLPLLRLGFRFDEFADVERKLLCTVVEEGRVSRYRLPTAPCEC